jgi:hypothetical protein
MKKIEKCKHEYKLSHTDWQYPDSTYSISGTNVTYMEEYAYLVCQKCWKVIKIKVE